MANSTYNRANFFGTSVNNDGVEVLDPIDFEFQSFIEFMRSKKVKRKRISESLAGAPDLISYQEYGDHQYWWVIVYINEISDPMNELVAGLEIAIPQLKDIEEFRQSRISASTRGEAVILR